MAPATKQADPDELRKLARRWFEQQLARSRNALGGAWLRHEEWVREYLLEEVRIKLIARGWRPRG